MPATTPHSTAPKIVRTEDIMHATGLARGTVYRLIRDGVIPKPRKLGHINYWPASFLADLIAGEFSATHQSKGAAS
jgi:predicted DNA-binding transcriptional regulator AlpA